MGFQVKAKRRLASFFSVEGTLKNKDVFSPISLLSPINFSLDTNECKTDI